MTKPVVLTGLRANNDLTLGNYLGALLPMIDMAKKRAGEYQVNLFVPDLHSFTTPIDHGKLYDQVMHNIKVYVAAGFPIDHQDVYVYRQSYVPAHSELTWILDCFTGFGEMSRMTQFKDKSGIAKAKKAVGDAVAHNELASQIPDEFGPELVDVDLELKEIFFGDRSPRVSVGLFNYPVLMAADILLYDATYVPVGDDQTQHLEFTRDIAERMNSKFGKLFTVPKSVKEQHEFFGKDQGLRIRDLIDPTKKMSKSDETGRGVIFLSDTPEAARKKIMGAATDSYGEIKFDITERPGIANLLQILALLGEKPQAEVNAAWEGKTSYGDLKKAVADVVAGFLAGFQTRLTEVDDKQLLAKLEQSETAMRETSGQTLRKVQQAVGLRAKA